jgi:hypothetical protein
MFQTGENELMRESNKSVRYLTLLMLYLPFLPFLYSVFNIRNIKYHGILLIFSFLYGYSVYMYSGDVVQYNMAFSEMVNLRWGDFGNLLLGGYVPKYNTEEVALVSGQPDIYASTLMFAVSRITDNSRWFFAVVSLIYTWLCLGFLREVYKELNWNNSLPQKIFFIFLLLIVPFYVGVTGVRFWTALFLFMIYAIKTIRGNNLQYILLSALSILIHFSFILPVMMLIMYKFINLKRSISSILIVASFGLFIFSSSTQVLNTVGSTSALFKDTTIETRVSSYGNADLLAERQQSEPQDNWYVTLRVKAILYSLLFAFLLEYFGLLKWQSNVFLDRLYPFYILSVIITLFTYNLGSLGRFVYIFYLLSFIRYTVIAGFNPKNKPIRVLSYIIAPVLLLHIAVIFRAGFYTVDPFLIIGNPFVIFLVQSSQSLSELLVGH